MTQSIAFHSYKGGTGKTTIACNLAAMLATKGYNVSMLDLDVYAPSLHAYFEKTPYKWINDLLSDNAKIDDVMVDMTSVIEEYAGLGKKGGKLWIGFSNPQKEEVYKLEGGGGKQANAKIQLLRKFIQLREDLISEYDSDYIIIDTSPGIRFWSINSLAIADTLFLTLKLGDLDIEGTRKMANDIYGSFTKFGAKSYLLLNRVGGYCVPNTPIVPRNNHHRSEEEGNDAVALPPQYDEADLGKSLSDEVSMDLISAIPCYCDIQFSRKEFLTVLQYPNHPFAKQLEKLATAKQIKV
ncbi:putative cobyrinic acid a,c-diamide synthase [Candidatus Nitrososphaera gargensis Ga9.2]|uniref:Putative cobyrinic acid a,c-diamide synthase n=1 Tax=Nitrososphaera gargensis (strain Ga9.2) TaxID=1237085 RepID=K0IK24_NITGG|nr:AAA family ATPase [Candidatus Nitrososphaera gargensis]AFU60480.1 putative cobyrinic acid a,c-diamide synthase [Candidatus Nitrososphaera gargensis Ga9.2]